MVCDIFHLLIQEIALAGVAQWIDRQPENQRVLPPFPSLNFISLFVREKGREGEREGEKHQCLVASHAPPTGDLVHNPGMCPDWELNGRPLG